MNKSKKGRFSQIAGLIIFVGAVLILSCVLFQKIIPSLLTSFITSISGVLMGAGIAWFLEEHFRNKYDRKSAYDYMQISAEHSEELIENLFYSIKKPKTIFSEVMETPEEKTLKSFRRKFHLYYSTKSKGIGVKEGKLFWNETLFDFTDVKTPGRLTSIVEYQDIDLNKFKFGSELCFTKGNGPIVIFEYPIKGTEGPVTFSVFRSEYRSQYADSYYGFMYHIDWNLKWRISPAVLSSTNRFNRAPQKLTNQEGVEIQNEWEMNYKNSVTVFQPYDPKE